MDVGVNSNALLSFCSKMQSQIELQEIVNWSYLDLCIIYFIRLHQKCIQIFFGIYSGINLCNVLFVAFKSYLNLTYLCCTISVYFNQNFMYGCLMNKIFCVIYSSYKVLLQCDIELQSRDQILSPFIGAYY